MDLRALARLQAWILVVVGIGVLAAAVVLAIHDGRACRTDEFGEQLCRTDEGLFAVRVLAFGVAAGLFAAAGAIGVFLRQTGPNPAR